jgi:hypothetical protein
VAAAGCSDPAAIRPTDVRIYSAAKEATRSDLGPPSAESRQPVESSPRLAIRYEPPPGWTDRGGSGMRLATLLVGDPADGHEVTVIPASGSLEANVARWLGQLDPEATPERLAERAAAALSQAEKLKLDAAEATMVVLIDDEADDDAGAEAAAREGILAGVIPLDGSSSLFVKLKGPAAVARRELENFRRFMTSIRWN